MGLYMYLSKRTYIGAEYEHRNVKGVISITVNERPLDIKFNRVNEIIERVGYWRKANAIHNWFVTNCQGGEDDCGDYEIEWSKFMLLKENCEKVLTDHSLSETLLPPKAGFFFGSTALNDDYFQDIKDTIEIINALISEKGDEKYFSGSLFYSSSW